MGWDLKGFGRMEALPENPGTLPQLDVLHRRARDELNAVVSYHR